MIMRAAPCDVSRTRHPLGAAGQAGSRMVPAFAVRPNAAAAARERMLSIRVLD